MDDTVLTPSHLDTRTYLPYNQPVGKGAGPHSGWQADGGVRK